jgi:hypothetical protein
MRFKRREMANEDTICSVTHIEAVFVDRDDHQPRLEQLNPSLDIGHAVRRPTTQMRKGSWKRRKEGEREREGENSNEYQREEREKGTGKRRIDTWLSLQGEPSLMRKSRHAAILSKPKQEKKKYEKEQNT